MNDDPLRSTVDRLLDQARTFAVVGASPRPQRPSYQVMSALLQAGYQVVPVTPMADEVLGQPTFPSLSELPPDLEVDVVDLFRREVAAHVDEAIDIAARAVWFQLGVRDVSAAARARAAGLTVIEERCPAIELARRGGAGPVHSPDGA